MAIFSLVPLLALFLRSTSAAPASSAASFTTPIDIDFSTYSSGSGSVSSFLSSNGLYVSSYQVGSTPSTHTFTPDNVNIANGALQMTVTGGAASGSDIKSAEVGTTQSSILYGNITTTAKISSVEGACSGFFFYKDDNNEIDIEILTSYITTPSANGDVPAGIELTNQALVPGQPGTNSAVAFSFDPTAAFHDYTTIWTDGQTDFYVDGTLLKSYTTNVPSTPGSWLWNNWSDGDVNWTAGPPTSDSVLQISRITGAYNIAS